MTHQFRCDRIRKIIPASIGDTGRLHLLAMFGVDVDASINERANIQSAIDRHMLRDGSVWVRVWQRDCDHQQSTDYYRIHATLLSYYCEYQRIAEGAEGPFSLQIIRAPIENFSHA